MAVNLDAVILEFIKDLDCRVKALESLIPEQVHSERADAYVEKYGAFVDKTVASKILGVTRATVYAMLADGRIDGAYEGKRVDVRSIARYITRKGETHAG